MILRGSTAGALGSLVVAIAQGAADVAAGRALFHTPGVLGLGMAGLPGVIPASADIVRFTAVHVVVFVIVGIVLSYATARSAFAGGAGGRPRRWIVGIVFLGVFFGSATMAEAWDPYDLALPSWAIAAWNVLALLVMGWVIRRDTVRDR